MMCAVIGDIVRSRDIADRNLVQCQLREILGEINKRYGEEIASNFTITLGDEFQGVLRRPVEVFDILRDITIFMHPIRIRYGVGVGDISTEINPEISIGADGPAYYRARGMLEQVKRSESTKFSEEPELMYFSDKPEDGIINSLVNLCWGMEHNWTPGQRNIISYYLETKKNQKEIAEHFSLSRSSVTRTFHSSNFYKYNQALLQLKNFLMKTYGGNTDET